LEGGKNMCCHNSRDGVCSVVEAVEEVEDQCYGYQRTYKIEDGHLGLLTVLQQHSSKGICRLSTAFNRLFQEIMYFFFLEDF